MLLTITHTLAYNTKVGVPVIKMPCLPPAWRNVDNLPPDPSATEPDHLKSSLVSANPRLEATQVVLLQPAKKTVQLTSKASSKAAV